MKPGDKVLCVDATHSCGKLQTNAIYKVAKTKELSIAFMRLVQLVGPCTDLWDQARFKLVEQVNETTEAPCRREDTEKS